MIFAKIPSSIAELFCIVENDHERWFRSRFSLAELVLDLLVIAANRKFSWRPQKKSMNVEWVHNRQSLDQCVGMSTSKMQHNLCYSTWYAVDLDVRIVDHICCCYCILKGFCTPVFLHAVQHSDHFFIGLWACGWDREDAHTVWSPRCHQSQCIICQHLNPSVKPAAHGARFSAKSTWWIGCWSLLHLFQLCNSWCAHHLRSWLTP